MKPPRRSARSALALDLSCVPFSRRGCWLNLAVPPRASEQPLGRGLYLRSSRARGVSPQREHFLLELIKGGESIAAEIAADPVSVLLVPRDGSASHAELFLEGNGTLRARGVGVGLRMTCALPSSRAPGAVALVSAAGAGHVEVNLRAVLRRYRLSARKHALEWRATGCVEGKPAVFEIGGDGSPWELSVDEFESAWVERSRLPFETARDAGAVEFAAFARTLPSAPSPWARARQLAAYLLWSCTKSASGFFRREAVFMSLNWMDGVWSWDNVFNAVALAGADPELALNQLRVMIDHQDALGAYPDRLDELVRHYNFSKPPVHGVLFAELERLHPAWWTPPRRRLLVKSVARNTEWWLRYRVWNGRTLAYYLHGNDSGWDNSTLFLRGVPLESPDLAALLAVQAGWLARQETRLGRKTHARRWQAIEAKLVHALLDQLWRDDQFVGRKLPEDAEVRSASLVDCMPVVLGRRLPPAVAKALVRRIRTFITPCGVASEQLDSPHYVEDGYWRGPVWAASTYLIVLGLESLGERRLANQIARRFCTTCAQNGFAENFHALTGAPLRDPGYTWTAGIFLLLAERETTRTNHK